MNYTVGQLARIYSISAQSIHSYVELGILPCTRDENGYRIFDDYAFQKLGTIIKSRNMGLHLKDCGFVYHEANELLIYNKLVEQKQELKKEINRSILKLNQLDEDINKMNSFMYNDTDFKIGTRENMYQFCFSNLEEIKTLDKEFLSEISKWYSNLFYTNSSLSLNYQNNKIIDYEYGMIATKQIFYELIDSLNSKVKIIDNSLVACAILKYYNDVDINLLEGKINEFFNNNKGYCLKDRPYTRLILSFSDINANKVNIFELIIPIKKI